LETPPTKSGRLTEYVIRCQPTVNMDKEEGYSQDSDNLIRSVHNGIVSPKVTHKVVKIDLRGTFRDNP